MFNWLKNELSRLFYYIKDKSNHYGTRQHETDTVFSVYSGEMTEFPWKKLSA